MFAFEVYGKRDDLYTTHLGSPAMTKFLDRIPASSTTNLDLAHYRCVAGFLDLHAQKGEAGVIQDVKITCTEAKARETLLGKLVGLVGSVQREVRENRGRDGVYTYMAFACLDDDVGVRIMGRWRDRGHMESFVRRADVGAFWAEGKEDVARMEQRLYLPNRKGWLHRGSGFVGEEKAGAKL
jgi:quinol monooxygenase YgiN